ncbi:glycosyltransferase family 39 protein [Chroogloeocystis siderophila]|uniref:Glycosyltransferase RgtA/B/C/D-like domain-containing protein n=1 Tax=Chroogloeocystis siderophila 5.2 s.c.1 TaxID=247279 RepID=A0A1U7HPC6_9CHRO|nr:hypothetical protein [Chroogloeocystis siderophila]OKH25450.1 hypothetical protein NIES1031_13860 [Chroogloeocystis siderophila 5.2 s.c.1]
MKPQSRQIKNSNQHQQLFRISSVGWQVFLLLGWIIVGSILRLVNLTAKPPWNDEFATVVFSLGNSFRTVPIDQAIALDTLLQPLQPNLNAGVNDVIQHLMSESTHPPIYFVLMHLWMKLFSTDDELASFWVARSLSVIFGVATIPAIFGLGYLAFRSLIVGQIAAAMMVVSPYGIYQAQEARHYTLAILLVIASLCCLVLAIRNLQRRERLPVWVVLLWVFINALGIAVHYFFFLSICATALVLLSFWIEDFYNWIKHRNELQKVPYLQQRNSFILTHWYRIYTVAISTVISSLVWIPVWQSIPDNQVTQWIFDENSFNLLESIPQFLAWIITMFALLPIEGANVPVMLFFGAVLIGYVVWLLPLIIKGIQIQISYPPTRWENQALLRYFLAAITLVFTISFSFGADLTIAARYHFFYFPVVIVLLAAAVTICWDSNKVLEFLVSVGNLRQQTLVYSLKSKGKKVVILLFVMGLLGSITVLSNFAYQKPDRPDLLVPIIERVSQNSTLIATTHFTHEQVGEMMGLALEFKHYYSHKNSSPNFPLFFLAHSEQNSSSIKTLEKNILQLPKPLNLWLVNFFPTIEPTISGCLIDSEIRPKMNGYKYRLYHCL